MGMEGVFDLQIIIQAIDKFTGPLRSMTNSIEGAEAKFKSINNTMKMMGKSKTEIDAINSSLQKMADQKAFSNVAGDLQRIGMARSDIEAMESSYMRMAQYQRDMAKAQADYAAGKDLAMSGVGNVATGAIGAFGIFELVKKAGEFQSNMAVIQDSTGATTKQMQTFGDAVMNASSKVSKFNDMQMAQIAQTLSSGGFGNIKDVQNLLLPTAKFAEVQMYEHKGSDPVEITKQVAEMAHTMKIYDPKQFEGFLNDFNKYSMMQPGDSSQLEQTLKYLAPTALTMGMKKNDIMSLAALDNVIGLTDSHGGTNSADMILRMIPGLVGGAPTKKKDPKAWAAMEDLGFIDKNGNSKFFNKDGSVKDLNSMLTTMITDSKSKNPKDLMKDYSAIFGVQGGRAAAILSNPQSLEQLGKMRDQLGKTKSMEQTNKDLQATPEGQINLLKSNSMTMMLRVGQQLAISLNPAIEQVNKLLGKLLEFSQAHPQVAKLIGDFALLAVGGKLAEGVIKIFAGNFKMLGNALKIFSLKNAAGEVTFFGKMLGGLGNAFKGAGVAAEAAEGAAAVGMSEVLLPVLAVVAAVAALAIGFKLAYDHIQPFHDAVNKAASTLKNGFFNAVHAVQNAFKPALNAQIEWSNGVSKSTQNAMNSYMNLSDSAKRSLETLQITGQTVSQDTAASLDNTYQKMADKIIGHFKDLENGASSALSDLKKTNKKEYDQILAETTKSNEDKIKNTQDTANQIKAIIDKASTEHRALTNDEQSQVNKLQDKMNTFAVQSMSKSQKEQEIILGQLKDHASKLSADQAANVVKNAKTQEDATIKSATNTFNAAVKAAQDKFNGVKNWADNEYFVNHAISKQQYEDIMNNATHTRDDSINAAKTKKDQVVGQASDEFNQTVYYAQKQATGHVDQVNWETGQVYSSWDKLKQNILNITNDILGFFGLPQISGGDNGQHVLRGGGVQAVSRYAFGTSGHPGGLALVGDGSGSNAGSEAIITPDGKLSFSPSKPTLVGLPRGTTVLSATNTRKMFSDVPHYENGIAGIAGNFANWMMSGPENLITKAFDAVGINNFPASLSQFGSTFAGIGTGAVNTSLKAAINWFKSKWNDWTGASGASGSASQWITEAMNIAGVPSSWLNGLLSLVQHESGGNPHAINLTDSNAKAGHPSKGLFQTIDSTFNSYAIKGLGDIWNPVANAVAGIRYIMDRYGDISNVPGIRSMMNGGGYVGYARGTSFHPGGLALVGEEGPELLNLPRGSQVLPHRNTMAMLRGSQSMALPSGSGTGGNIYITVNANGNITRNEHELGQIVSRAILNQTKMQGRI
jgi:TP901 family phage tail tape measure protein